MTWQLIHADDDLLVIDKPSGLLCQPGRGPDKQDCLVGRVAAEFPGARIVHRLDRDTSGVIVLARHAEAHRRMSRQFEERSVEKHYVAIVAGQTDELGEIDLPLGKDWEHAPRHRVDFERGKPALTRFRVLERNEDQTTRLQLEPVTGRSHQLRVHLSAIGHPVLGDNLYAPSALRPPGLRLQLHAWQIRFEHPRQLTRQTFQALLPF